jgi:predicted negative regulator of RcsB-dependent stress response
MEAVEAVKRAIELDATNALLKAFCSHIQLQSGSAHNALFYIDLAIQDDATIAMFHRHRGSVLEKLGRTEEALRAAQTAVSMDEANLEFKGYLAHVQAQAERAPGGAAAAT